MMNADLRRKLLVVTAMSVLLTASECLPPTDDDDASDDDDAAGDDDDAASDDDDLAVGDTEICGEVVAVDRDTGLELNSGEYASRAGGLIVYALPDGSDLSDVLGKATMTGPGEYCITVSGYVGPVDVVAVVDEDGNHFIDSHDTAREHAFNPLAAAGNPIDDVDVVVDLAEHGGGGGGGGDDDDDGGCPSTLMSGNVVIDGLPEGQVAVSTNSADLSDGPWNFETQAGSGPFSVAECNWHGSTSLLGYLDADGNSYFEPSDPIGEANINPITLGIGDVSGATISIPGVDVDAPAPPAYVAITGTVAYSAFSTGDILVKASHVTTDGYVYSQVTLAAPGGFALLAPENAANTLIWAVLDADGDGEADPAVDPSDSFGPTDTGNGLSGIDLELGPSAPGVISGSIFYSGPLAPGDVLHIGLFETEDYSPADGPPAGFADVLNPAFPYNYSFEVSSGTYWVGAYVDVGGDDPSTAGPEDPESQSGPVLLAPGGAETANVVVPATP